MLSLHRRIRTLRARRGLTGLELARRVGVSPSYVSLIEHGEKVPSEDVAVRIAQALDDREDLYRVWSATARMDERTRRALLSLDRDDPDIAPYLESDAVESAPRTTLPPPHVVRSGAPPLVQLFREEAMARALPIPLLVSGEISCTETPADHEVQAALAIDGALVGRESPDGLVALRVDDDNGRLVRTWLQAGDVTVLDCHADTFEPARIHLCRRPVGPPVFARLSLADDGRTLWLLPDPSDRTPPERIDLADGHGVSSVVVGPVVLAIRRW
ncbi:MAG: hypothetical protein Kow0062_27270 [Acidobacteriota bacterium]